jgi:C4-dicarboxylate-specific signal transduction histidine kinase
VNYARPGPLVLSKISLHRLIEDTLAFLEHQPMLRGKQLENSVPRGLPHIRADANQLSQVLMNLLLNAAEATPEGGRISITASKLTFVDMIKFGSVTPDAASQRIFWRMFSSLFSRPNAAVVPGSD